LNIDIKTLAILLCITNVLQVISLSILARVKMSCKGLGCWILANVSLALGFLFNYLRDDKGIGLLAIVVNNLLFIAALALIYAGVLRFFNQREKNKLLVLACLTVTLIALYFTFVDNSQAARRVNFSFAVGIFSFFIARALYIHRTEAVNISAHFLSLVFLGKAVFFMIRAVTPFTGGTVGSLFSATLTQTMTYMVVLVACTLWTFGFIIMINQRLAFESQEAKIETETALANEQLMLLEQRQFISMLSHEFRTPLAVADFAAANLTEVPPIDQDDINQRVIQIRRSISSMVQLIENCMTRERIEFGGFTLMRQDTELIPLLTEAAHMVDFSARHTLELITDKAPLSWPLDSTLFRIALSNLIDNAVKYTKEGKIILRAEECGEYMSVTVTDQGPGITPADVDILFEKFVRGSAANSGKSIRGAGLGLYISKRIAVAHGGDLRLLSGAKGATVFELLITKA